MHPSYDIVSAAQQLEVVARERSTEKLAGVQLSDWCAECVMDTIQVIDDGNVSTKRMIRKKEAPSIDPYDSEIVWHVQGVLTILELPPFIPKGRFKDKVKFLRQGVRLSGLDTPSFDRASQSIKDIIAVFSRSVTKIQQPTFIGEDERGIYLDVSNRYFSSSKDNRGGMHQSFSADVDPTGSLTLLGGAKYYHGEENNVMYLERHCSNLTGKKYTTPVSPVTFKAGDIAEVQVTFMLVPLKGDEWKLVNTLRCVTLLDRRFTQNCMKDSIDFGIRLGDSRRSNQHVRVLKRRAGYDLGEEDGESVPTGKMARMNLEE